MNERDSERVAVFLQRQGHSVTRRESAAEVVIVNTCSVREKAEDKALGKLRLLLASKRERPDRIVGAIGCMVQRMGGDIFRKVRGLDFAVGTFRLARVPAILAAVSAGQGPVIDIQAGGGREDQDGHEPGRVTAFISVLFGCNRRCAYCVVPQVRGGEWSRPAEDIIAETRCLVSAGVREVTLLGQSIMAYGRANPAWPAGYQSARGFSEPLPRLLEALQAVPGLERIRFTSGHPSGCTGELIRAMAELPAVCEHLHLPLQSGSDRLLSRMNRGYSAADYRDAVRRLRAALPGMALTTDIMVGFPSETSADFDMTRAFMAEIGFDNAFIFKYNPRPETPADQWADDVPEAEKIRRHQTLLQDQNRQCLALNQALVGREVEALVEGHSRRNAARWTGRTRTNKIVLLDASSALRRGQLLTIKIDDAKIQTLYGTVILAKDG